MAKFYTAALLLLCTVLFVDSSTGQLSTPSLDVLDDATQVKNILLDRCQKDWDSTELKPTPKPLPMANIVKRCSAGERLFGDRLVVVAKHKENITDLAKFLEPPLLVYSTGDDEAAHRADNYGNEASAYLTFIAEYYDCLPETVLFAHAHRFSPLHSSNSLDYDANTVNWHKVPGFAPKDRGGRWYELLNIHNPDLSWQHPIQKNLTPAEAAVWNCFEVHGGVPYRGDDGNQHLHGVMVNRAWGELFEPSGFGPMPDKIRSSVHGEMFVTAAAVRAQPREFYLQALQWMKQSLVKGPWNRWALGGVFELTWHIIFGQPAWMAGMPIPECELYRCSESTIAADRIKLHKFVQTATQ